MSGVEILLSDNRGVYIPQDFVRNHDVVCWGFDENDADILTLRKGPDAENEWYWSAWDRILMSAQYTDSNGNVWLLSQDGDLFAYCEAMMDYDEKVAFFGWADEYEDDGQPTEAEEWASFDPDC